MNRLLALISLVMLASCSTGFEREWRQALAGQAKTPRHDLAGAWEGTWRSDADGHHGDLRCIVTQAGPVQSGAQGGMPMRFHYHATYKKILSGSYDVTHVVRKTRDGFVFSGDQKLTGLGAGNYHYEGKGTPEHFTATFRSERDHGVFDMKRPAASGGN